MWFPEPLEGTDYDNDSVDNSYYEDDDKNVYSSQETKVFGFQGEYGCKAET